MLSSREESMYSSSPLGGFPKTSGAVCNPQPPIHPVHIFIINGPAGAGKDTFCKAVGDALHIAPSLKDAAFENFSTIDHVKWLFRNTGIDVDNKTPELRAALANTKAIFEGLDWALTKKNCNSFGSLIPANHPFVGFVHIREIEGIEKFKEFIAQHPTVAAREKLVTLRTVLVRRPGIDPLDNNEADANVYGMDYDITVYNNDTVESLQNLGYLFARDIAKGEFKKIYSSTKLDVVALTEVIRNKSREVRLSPEDGVDARVIAEAVKDYLESN